MTTESLYADPAHARFYDHHCPWSPDCDFCLALAREGSRTVLDLGCGTGRLAVRIAAETGAETWGVDPAPAMLSQARSRTGGAAVRWVDGDARTARLGRRFDLVVMTGHAFQTLLTPADRAAALATIAVHLSPGGRFVFDSRNPNAREWLSWTPEASRETFAVPGLGTITAWNNHTADEAAGIITYSTFYDVPAEGRTLSSVSRIAFPPYETLANEIAEAGLTADRWMGEWDGRPYAPDAPEIIPVGRLA